MASRVVLVWVVAALCAIGFHSSWSRERRYPYELCELMDPIYLRPDRTNQLLRVPEGIPLGATGKEDTLFVWRNGIVTFGVASSQADLSSPTRNHSMANAEYFVAPLWFPTLSTDIVQSSVSWEEERKGEGNKTGYILQFASNAVGNHSLTLFKVTTEFNPTWAIIVNWNVSLTPQNSTERHFLCDLYRSCFCSDSDYDYPTENGYDHCQDCYNNSYNCPECYEGGSGCESDEECFAERGWSPHDVEYLSQLCALPDYYFYKQLRADFQLVLATDGVNTHAVFLYQCDYIFFEFSYDNVDLLGSYSIGYRLGNHYDNFPCIGNDILHIFTCVYYLNCDGFFRLPDNYINTLLSNLTSAYDHFQYFADLEKGLDYIEFQSTNLNINYTRNGTNSTSNLRFLPRRLDGSSAAILHAGIGVGTTVQNNIYVGTNGIISFGRPFYFWYPHRFPSRYPWIRDTYVAAPFWHDVDIRSAGDVAYAVLSPEDSPHVFTTVKTFLNYQNVTIDPEWMLVAAWLEVPVYPHYYVQKYPQYYSQGYRDRILNNFNTFEAILVTSGPDTYVIYTYNCELLTNPGLYSQAVIGYNLGGFEYFNNLFSESFAAHRISCSHWPSSNWFNVIYKLNSGEDEILRAQRMCQKLVADDDKKFSKIVDVYQNELSPCPCSIRNAWRDRNFRWDSDNFYCYYRRLPNIRTGSFDQYCCYDTNFQDGTWGALVKSGYRVSGMALMEEDHNGRSVSRGDTELRRYCCALAGQCDLFLKRRPPNDCSGYQPPVWTWAWGDPHITTLDDHSYTFNGYGEYVLLRYGDSVELQGRMRPTPNTQDGQDSQATQFSAFTIGYISGSRVEINCDDPDPFCATLYNGTDISAQLVSVNNSFYSAADMIEVVRETNTTVTVVMGLGITLAVTYNSSTGIPNFQLTLDPQLSTSGTMVGLLGNRNGDHSNDMIFRNGSQLNVSTATDRDIFEFGNSWLITTLAESLFTYTADEGPLDYHNDQWMPTFTSDLLTSAPEEVLTACTPAGASAPLEQCVFDAVATGDVNIGMATMDTLNDNTLAMAESTNMPPVISGDKETLYLSLSLPLSLTLSITDDNDNDLPLSLVTTPPGSSLLPGQPGEYTFTWTLTGLDEEDEVSPLVFAAMDSLGAASTFSPHLQVCACQNDGNCTLEGLVNPNDTLVIMNCICPPAWEGRYCQRDVDGCLEFACLEGVECFDVPAPGEGAECAPCPDGYSADGVKCRDIDECAGADGVVPCEQVCTNTEGSYECSCNRGYLIDPTNTSRCIDFDECGYRVAGCDQICTNTEGSFLCSCEPGFISSGTFCDPEKSCDRSYTGCGSAHCANVSGIVVCYCEAGYQININGNGCDEINECESGTCSHMCTNLPGTFACSCRDGYELGADFNSCVDVDECMEAALRGVQLCSEGEVCVNGDGDYSCVCAPGLFRVAMVAADGRQYTECASLTVNEEFAKQNVIATFAMVTAKELFESGGIDVLSEAVAMAVRAYCREERCEVVVEKTASGKRATPLTYDPTSDVIQTVFDIDGVVSSVFGVSVPFYVQVTSESETGVLNREDTLAALQANAAVFQSAFGEDVLFSLTYPTPATHTLPPVTADDDDSSDQLDTAVVAGVTAASAVVALCLVTSLALVLYFCIEQNRKKKSSKHDKRALLTEGGAREMDEVPPQPPKITEDPGNTVFVNKDAA